jgi:hypothetical protein
MKRSILAAAAVLALAAPAAQAGVYKCVDSKGVTHYGDKLPPQCAGLAVAELNKRGVVVKKTDRALTAEELKAQETEAEQHKAEAQKEATQRRSDNALLASYSSPKEIEAARDRELQRVEAWIATAKTTQTKQLGPDEKKRLDTMIDQARKEADAIRAKYDGYRSRYIELKKEGGAGDKVSKL